MIWRPGREYNVHLPPNLKSQINVLHDFFGILKIFASAPLCDTALVKTVYTLIRLVIYKLA